jgi:AraC-like DNA-binding protein
MAWHVEGLPDATVAERPPRFPAVFIRPVAFALRGLGLDTARFRSGLLEPERDGSVPAVQYLEGLEEIAVQLGIPHLGIELARNLPLGAFGLTDYRFSASATLGEALVSFDPHQGEFLEAIRYELHIEHLVRVEMCSVFRLPRLYPVAETFGIAFVVRRLRDVLGDAVAKVAAVRLVCPAPPATRIYDDFFGVGVEFGGQSYEVAFAPELLNAPLLTANPELARVLTDKVQAPDNPPRGDPFLERVRLAIRESLGEELPTVGILPISNRLGLTPRSLQRRLREQNMSFSSLVDEARRALALELLSHEGLLLCEIAYRLGFGGVTAFFRAFRRWTGSSPREFQRTRGSDA